MYHPLVSHWRLSGQDTHLGHREILNLLMCFFFDLFNFKWKKGMDILAHAICCVWCDIKSDTVIKNSEQLTEQIDAMCFHEKTKTLLMIPSWYYLTNCRFQKSLVCLQLWHFVWMTVLLRKYFEASIRHNAWSHLWVSLLFVLRC